MTKWEIARMLAGDDAEPGDGFEGCPGLCHICPFRGIEVSTITRKMARDWLAANPEPEAAK